MDKLPTCSEYSSYLEKAVKNLRITLEEARSKYGLYTKREWEKLLNTHDKLRNILQEYNSPEWGDCIIDEICELFNFPLTPEE